MPRFYAPVYSNATSSFIALSDRPAAKQTFALLLQQSTLQRIQRLLCLQYRYELFLLQCSDLSDYSSAAGRHSAIPQRHLTLPQRKDYWHQRSETTFYVTAQQ